MGVRFSSSGQIFTNVQYTLTPFNLQISLYCGVLNVMLVVAHREKCKKYYKKCNLARDRHKYGSI